MRTTVAALSLFMAAQAMAQGTKEDLFKDLVYGNRVEVTLKSGYGILGKLIPVTQPGPKGDFKEVPLAQASTILLDIALEYPEVGGRRPPLFGFDRHQVKAVRKLPNLTLEEVKAREKARERALEKALADEARLKQEEQDREEAERKELEAAAKKEKKEGVKTEEDRIQVELDRRRKAREIYEKFPPEAGWGQEKIADIAGRASRRQPITLEEREFQTGFAEWSWYNELMKKEREGAEKKEEKTTEEAK